MSERAAFIDAILGNPADDTARLVFADWLEEHGEPERAEFVRAQIEAASLPGATREQSAPCRRADALLQAHRSAWRDAVGFVDGDYERGFLTGVTFESSEFAIRAPLLLTREPAEVRLLTRHRGGRTATLGEVGALAEQPLLRGVSVLDNAWHWFGAKRFARLLRSPHLRNLRAIRIGDDPLDAPSVRAIDDAPAPFALKSLYLRASLDEHASARDEAVRMIATSPRFAALQNLGLTYNGLTNDHVRALLASATLPRSLRIDLEGNDFDEDRFADALAERFVQL